ncbi:haloacid dehalogenase type II [Salegentibacter chungangensis]|uniref:Haloacid dehalogenase type II n=1 Tax=Salegentibacter chungangensis TaxID=1335724 RepID=A0ABW3NP55_9FLAO
MKPKPELLIFDVNETLLDMSPLKDAVNRAFGNELAFEVWFPTLLQYSLVESITENYNDFSSIALATLEMTAEKFGAEVSESELKSVLSLVKELPPHPEVPAALKMLKDSGFRMIALTNGKPDVAEAQLKFAEIDMHFEETLSVEEAGKYKPHPGPYNYVLQKTGISREKAMMVAAHGWDITGAKRNGMQTAFIKRVGKSEYPLAGKADLLAASCLELAEMLIDRKA